MDELGAPGESLDLGHAGRIELHLRHPSSVAGYDQAVV